MAISREISVVVRGLKREVETGIKRIVLNAVANLTEDTPLDTGWARANWIPSITAPVDGVDGSRESISTSKKESGTAKVATSYVLENGPVWISNNVPYILRLNEGTSKQAPAGFVEAAIFRAVRPI